MELKEVVNLRKLREYADSKDLYGISEEEHCQFCPFGSICPGKSEFTSCLIDKMIGENDDRDLYDIERESIDDENT